MLLHALIAVQAVAVPVPSEPRTFRDWTVGCDNGRACEAIALLPEGSDWEGWTTLSLRRDAAADAAPVFVLPDLETTPAMLAADGTALSVTFSTGDDGIVVTDTNGSLLRALRSAAAVEARDAAGASVGRVSLAGASAALLFMDDVQRRVGTTTALVRPGTKPTSAVPAAPPLPRIRRAPPPADIAALPSPAQLAAALGACAEELEGAYNISEQEPVQIATGTVLVLQPCGSGAYNFASQPLIARSGRLADAAFDFPDGEPPLLVNATWEDDRRLLTEYNKGRGLGDCGSAAEYAWDGSRFRLVRYGRMDECRGSLRRITVWCAEVTD